MISWLRKRLIWLLFGGLVIVAIVGLTISYQQQPQDAEFTMPETDVVVNDDRSPVQLEVQPTTQPTPRTSGLEVERSPGQPAESVAPSLVVEPEPAPVCSNDIEGVVIPSLDVSATTVPIGLDENGVLGDPSHADRMAIGVYTAGSMPGEPGNTLINGHTYINGSSVFDHSFGTDLKVGDSISLVSGDCIYSYQVQQMWPNLAKHPSDVTDSAPLFSDVIDGQDLFRQQGPSGLVVMTCAGEFDYSSRHHQDEAVAYALLTAIEPI